jgi:hypothetical protein
VVLESLCNAIGGKAKSLAAVGCPTLAIAALMACSACDRAVTQMSTVTASWSYVEDAWGGVALSESRVSGNQLSLILRVGVHDRKRMDSGTCLCGAHARLDASRVVVSLGRCLCGPGAGLALVAGMAKPAAGAYDVVYDDSTAGFPRIGQLTVP